MTSTNWIMIAKNDDKYYIAQTEIKDKQLVYRALSKWLIRGNAGTNILKQYWEYIDQYDNKIEEALLDQLLTQAETAPPDPQITNVRTRDYSIEMIVHYKKSNSNYTMCSVGFKLYVYFHSLKTKIHVCENLIDVILMQDVIEKVQVSTMNKTPAPGLLASKRVSKRSSKSQN